MCYVLSKNCQARDPASSLPRAWIRAGGSMNTGSGRCTCMAQGTQPSPEDETGSLKTTG